MEEERPLKMYGQWQLEEDKLGELFSPLSGECVYGLLVTEMCV